MRDRTNGMLLLLSKEKATEKRRQANGHEFMIFYPPCRLCIALSSELLRRWLTADIEFHLQLLEYLCFFALYFEEYFCRFVCSADKISDCEL